MPHSISLAVWSNRRRLWLGPRNHLLSGRHASLSRPRAPVLDVGAANLTAQGEVFNLKSLADFAGNYFEVVEAVVRACGARRVSIRLSPLSPVNDIGLDSDPQRTYSCVIERLNGFGLAYAHIIEGITQGPRDVPFGFDLQVLGRLFKGAYMANNDYDLELALAVRRTGRADLIAFGRTFIANPDLPERLRTRAPLNTPDHATFFEGRHRSYTVYPFLEATERRHR